MMEVDVANLLPGGNLRSQALFLLAKLGRELGAEVVGLEDLANLELALSTGGVRAALGPFHRLFFGSHLPDPKTCDQLFGLGERTVDDGSLRAGELDPRALRARMEALS